MDQIKENLGNINHEIQENIHTFNSEIKENLKRVDVESVEKNLLKVVFGIFGGILLVKAYHFFFDKELPSKSKYYLNSFALDIHQFTPTKLKLSSTEKSITGKTRLEKSDEKIEVQGSYEGNHLTIWIILKEDSEKLTKYTLKGEIEGNFIKGFYETNDVRDSKPFQIGIQKKIHYLKKYE